MANLDDLLQLMSELRDPIKGCPWDKVQTHETIAPYTIEEAYEVAEAIITKDMQAFKEELGDLLFQVIFQSQIAQENKEFDFHDVLTGLVNKMRDRHPHVFGDEKIDSIEEQNKRWQEIKDQEKSAELESILDSVPKNIPPLLKADKLQKKAARLGFDWPNIDGVIRKIEEELEEVKREVENQDRIALEDELGDLVFSCVNLIRFAKLDPNIVLAKANKKFEMRFKDMEMNIHRMGKNMLEMDVFQLEEHWQAAKNNG